MEWRWGLAPVTALRAMPGAHKEAGHRKNCTLPIQCQIEVKDPSQHEDVENCFGNAPDTNTAPVAAHQIALGGLARPRSAAQPGQGDSEPAPEASNELILCSE